MSDEADPSAETVTGVFDTFAQLEKELLDEAVTSGLITPAQAESIRLEAETAIAILLTSSDAGFEGDVAPVSAAEQTVSLMVGKGLITQNAGRELRERVEGEFIPGYRLEGELGRGAMGVVYKAVQTKLDRQVALKVINPSLARDTAYVDRFKREALSLAKLNHPNIVQVYDYGEANRKIYIALELVEGCDVSDLIKASKGGMDEQRSLRIIRDSALGLSHALKHKVIHRDIKPANLLICDAATDALGGSGTTKVTDLGLARDMERTPGQAELTRAGTILGSPAYMAPEQTTGEKADHRADIYALGATLYNMVTGEIPFASATMIEVLVKKRLERLESPRDLASGLSVGLVRVLDRMLSKTLEERYQTYEELIADLDTLLAGETPAATPVSAKATTLMPCRAPAPIPKPVEAQVAPVAQEDPPPPASVTKSVVAAAVVIGLLVLGATQIPRTTAPDGRPSLEKALDSLGGLAPVVLVTQFKELEATKADIEALPTSEQRNLRLRFNGIVNEALADLDPAEVLEESHDRGDYAKLATAAATWSRWYALVDRDVPANVAEFAAKAAAARTDGLGAAERNAWTAAVAAKDPVRVLALTEGFAERFAAFSPVLEKVAKLRADARAKAPVVAVSVVPASATLTVDGEPRAAPWSGRLRRGLHTVAATADGYLPYEHALTVDGPITRTLHLGPVGKALEQAPSQARPLWRGAKRFLEDWRQTGEGWRPNAEQAGVEGEGPGQGYATVVQDFTKLTTRAPLKGAAGISLSWELVPNPDSRGAAGEGDASAEARLHQSGRRAVALGYENGKVYAGVRTGHELEVRFRRAVAAPPKHYRADWDGDVLTLWIDQTRLWSIRPDWAKEGETLEFAIRRGRALFRQITATVLK